MAPSPCISWENLLYARDDIIFKELQKLEGISGTLKCITHNFLRRGQYLRSDYVYDYVEPKYQFQFNNAFHVYGSDRRLDDSKNGPDELNPTEEFIDDDICDLSETCQFTSEYYSLTSSEASLSDEEVVEEIGNKGSSEKLSAQPIHEQSTLLFNPGHCQLVPSEERPHAPEREYSDNLNSNDQAKVQNKIVLSKSQLHKYFEQVKTELTNTCATIIQDTIKDFTSSLVSEFQASLQELRKEVLPTFHQSLTDMFGQVSNRLDHLSEGQKQMKNGFVSHIPLPDNTAKIDRSIGIIRSETTKSRKLQAEIVHRVCQLNNEMKRIDASLNDTIYPVLKCRNQMCSTSKVEFPHSAQSCSDSDLMLDALFENGSASLTADTLPSTPQVKLATLSVAPPAEMDALNITNVHEDQHCCNQTKQQGSTSTLNELGLISVAVAI